MTEVTGILAPDGPVGVSWCCDQGHPRIERMWPDPDVPATRPYEADEGRITPAAEYRAIEERLKALGFKDGSHYTKVLQALTALEAARKVC